MQHHPLRRRAAQPTLLLVSFGSTCDLSAVFFQALIVALKKSRYTATNIPNVNEGLLQKWKVLD